MTHLTFPASIAKSGRDDGEGEFGLDLILDGLEKIRANRQRK